MVRNFRNGWVFHEVTSAGPAAGQLRCLERPEEIGCF
jgi:hypothetical protein